MMTDNIPIGVIYKIVITIPLVVVSFAGIAGYFYIDIRRFYQQKESRWWAGLLAMGLPLTSFTSGIGILMLWNPLARKVFWFLIILAGGVSFILRESIVSPYVMADFWNEIGKRLKKKNKSDD